METLKTREFWKQDEIDYLVKNCHSNTDVKEIAARFNKSQSAVRAKAARLGFKLRDAKKLAPWTDDELELLEAWAEAKPFPELVKEWQKRAKAKGWAKRTPDAIRHTIYHKVGSTLKVEVGWYRVNAIAAGLGVHRGVVVRWVETKKLKVRRIGDKEIGCYIVAERDLVDFALKYSATITERLSPESMCWLLQVIKQSREKMWN